MKLQQQPPEVGCTLERVVASLMPWSDSTHLANFGTASLWPLYLFFGNQSKWVRGKPKTASCHHVAYIPKVSNGYSIRKLFDVVYSSRPISWTFMWNSQVMDPLKMFPHTVDES